MTGPSVPFSSRTTLLVELSCEGSHGLSYLPGEHLGVFPSNPPALVQGILERVVDSPAPHQPVCLETLSETGEPSALSLHANRQPAGTGPAPPAANPVLPAGRAGHQAWAGAASRTAVNPPAASTEGASLERSAPYQSLEGLLPFILLS